MRSLLFGLLLAPLTAAAIDDEPRFIGGGLYSRPKFDGSSKRNLDPIPAVHYMGQRWFARTTEGILEGGARWAAGESAAIGIQAAYEQGPLDRHPGMSLGVHADLEGKLGPAPIYSVFRLRQFLNNGSGWEADARITVGVYEGRGLSAAIYGQATWANEKIFNNYYAVNDSGLLFSSLGLLGGYDLGDRWLLLFNVEQRRLGDAAMPSSHVERRASTYASLSLAYKF